ncbi:MAG: fumarylacetoacetase [Bacteroidetes bacterium]|nr:fumarylacetoacetase [Bacteroidota bacterium]
MNNNRTSWINVEPGSDFPIQNLPLGIFSVPGKAPSAATRIGDTVISLYSLAKRCFFEKTGIDQEVFNKPELNDFIALGKPAWHGLRESLSEIFRAENLLMRDYIQNTEDILSPVQDVEMMMPVKVGDYTDFYSSIEHATNVGIMFRDPANALLPNWRHIPVGYHGRSSSIVVSGTPIHRPKGQTNPGNNEPVFGPTKEFDFELEMAFITGQATPLGSSVSTAEAEDHVFGLLLFNDLSARDIQRWEYVPLGPFLSKNFGSVVSPWIVTLEALEPFRVPGPVQEPAVLPYLKFSGDKNFDITLDVLIQPEGADPARVCRSNFRYMYWNMAQQLAHQTVNGCNINVGDMYGSGTISGPTSDSFGSMLEIAWKGTKPVTMADGTTRTFINDNDTIIMKGFCEKDGLRIGFGEVVTKILAAI